jgi:ATP-dependent RNA helicase DDX46/PRP5
VATPGRLIDILTMQSGKILSMQRVTYVVLDEADRIFDMGFSSQIGAILAAVRPDRQTVLFSATFPKAVELVAKQSLKYPVEVIVGGRSVASDNVTQYAELVEQDSKFLRLLQLLGENADEGKKVIVFVSTQVLADSIFEQLLRCGYVCLTLHGGKDQEDRDSTISDFKKKGGPNVLVATGVAGRGLDVPSCQCVINFSAPNHLEAYVHQVGRTGRAGRQGVSYTFCNSTDEAMYAPIIVRALTEAGQAENISDALKNLSDSFKAKVERGEAKYAGSGFKGRGYTYDSTELSEAQKLARLEKRQALIEAGLLDPDDEDPALEQATEKAAELSGILASTPETVAKSADKDKANKEGEIEVPDKLTPELLALPGMKQAILKKAGILPEPSAGTAGANGEDAATGKIVQLGPNHFLQELDINDYPREARWKVTQKETTSRLQDEFQTAVTLKGEYFGPGRTPVGFQRRLYLHLEATSERILKNCVLEIQRLLNEETLRAGARSASSGGGGHKYSVL